MRITKQHKGKSCTYHGFDGKAYAAVIADVHKGVVVIDYTIRGDMVRAYVDRPFYSRLQIATEAA